MIRAPAFWWRPRPGGAARLLKPAAGLIGRRAAARMAEVGAPPPLPVICVGNAVAGGAGKTPLALALGEMAALMGRAPAFLSRGYGGRLKGPVLVTGRHDAAAVGDEALLLAAVAPTVVARDRPAGAALAAAHGADLLIMDDGFQNPSLEKTLALLVIDGAVGVGNGLVLPAGPLRAPLGVQLARADALVVMGPGAAGDMLAAIAETHGIPVHRARLAADRGAAARLNGRRVVAFAGIGRPEKFALTLVEAGATIERLVAFPDHHRLSEAAAARLIRLAGRHDLVTTAKDFARLSGQAGPAFAALRRRATVVPVAAVFDDPRAPAALIEEAGRRHGPVAPRPQTPEIP
ncbi:MAG TPA: tetraacyldisaccharide 4'-kinase [Hyphomicrobiales bacterium]|nr:tetraacyldisaccharide 4'-kinase [Hyphomicrobiales bacterium]